MSDEDDFLNHMLEVGVIVVIGIEDGEPIYSYDFPVMKELMPEMYKDIVAGIDEKLMLLFERDFVSVEYDENLVAHFTATEKGMKYFDKYNQT